MKSEKMSRVLVLGAGPIVIGQASEFDYSGTQACKALKERGYHVILVNSNPATIMTDPQIADTTYIEPLSTPFLEKIIDKEKPHGILITMGGQIALNLGLRLEKSGFLKKRGVKILGTSVQGIDQLENRKLFRKIMRLLNHKTPRSAAAHSVEEGIEKVSQISFPVIIRPSFTLGGSGGGVAYDMKSFPVLLEHGLRTSPINEVLIEKSISGWKEYEIEILRDYKGNCITLCCIENIDPVGIHTGDSVAVAPALNLCDKTYQKMRNIAKSIMDHVQLIGAANIQFAYCPDLDEILVIEVNPRVSRSSALASKVTGYPIAKVATCLSVGYVLTELTNDVVGSDMPAAFEPSCDYIVVKMPRFAFEKFPKSEPVLTTYMKSVGEVMAIGGTFQEALQKALQALEIGLKGLDEEVHLSEYSSLEDAQKEIKRRMHTPSPCLIRLIADALRADIPESEIISICHYHRWFVQQIRGIVETEEEIIKGEELADPSFWRYIKSMGFSDARIAYLTQKTEKEIRDLRIKHNVHPFFKRVDTCSAEFECHTAYMYSTYCNPVVLNKDFVSQSEVYPSSKEKVVILGSGPNRIGQGIEFDYCCCHAAFYLKEVNIESIIINSNPETVSTDFDTADRLYFEPVLLEYVFEIIRAESQRGNFLGIIIQFGGQTPLHMAKSLAEENISILGTSYENIDICEDRDKFSRLLRKLNLKKTRNISVDISSRDFSLPLSFPVLIRPSYVLGGYAMKIIYTDEALQKYMDTIFKKDPHASIIIDQYLEGYTEFDADAIHNGKSTICPGIMKHIEKAGVHSGDSTIVIPAYDTPTTIISAMHEKIHHLAKAINIRGVINIQFAIKEDDIIILEVNPRASRSIPLIAKTLNYPFIQCAMRTILSRDLLPSDLKPVHPNTIGIKEAVFPFSRFSGVDSILGPEMRSTGEVLGIDNTFAKAFLKSQIATGYRFFRDGYILIALPKEEAIQHLDVIKKASMLQYDLISYGETFHLLKQEGVACEKMIFDDENYEQIHWDISKIPIRIVFSMSTPEKKCIKSFLMRRYAINLCLPLYTTRESFLTLVKALMKINVDDLEAKSIQDLYQSQS